MTLDRHHMTGSIIVMFVLLSLVVQAGAGNGSASVRVTGILLPRQPPVAQFTSNATNGNAPLTVQFTDTSTNLPTSWNWSFGDGDYATVQNPVYMYASAGTFTVNLTVSNAIGNDTLTQPGYITVTPGGGGVTPVITATPNPVETTFAYSGGGGGSAPAPVAQPAAAPQPAAPPAAPPNPATNQGVAPPAAAASLSTGVGVSYNSNGQGTLSIDVSSAEASGETVSQGVAPDGEEYVTVDPPDVILTFWGHHFTIANGIVTGQVTHAELKTDPLNATLAFGNVSSSVQAVLPQLVQRVTINVTIPGNVSTQTLNQFQDILGSNDLHLNTVAYTFDVQKVNLTTGPANVTFTVPASWVNQNGGKDAVRITHISDETGKPELLDTVYEGLDDQSNMIFRGYSPNGTSLFGLVTAEAYAAEETEHPNETYAGISRSSMVTNEGMYSWALGIILKNPVLLVPIAAIFVVFAYFGWWKRRL